MCKMLKGKYLDFDPESRICLNPFTFLGAGLTNNEVEEEAGHEVPAIGHIIHTMVYSSTDGTAPVKALEMDIIQSAVRRAWKEYGNDADIDVVYSNLMKIPDHAGDEFASYSSEQQGLFRNTAQTLAFSLKAFTSKGNYGRWFNGPSTFNISRDEFVVLEIDKLTPMKELFKVVTLQVINAVTQDLYLSDRDRKRLIIFDEAWKYMKEGDALKTIIEEGYRKARKYQGSFTIITQSVTDLSLFGSVGKVIKGNSQWKIYLKDDNFEMAKKEGLIEYEDFWMHLMKSMRTVRGKYSEMFIDGPYGRGVARLAVDPFSYYVYTSDPDECSEIEKIAEEKGVDYAEAIQEMVRKYRG
jgi:conjugal transfer ATP-binding protein TraC